MAGGMADKQQKGVRVLVVWLGALGVTFYNFQPFLVGGFVSLLGMSDSQAGLIAASNMLAVCISLALATYKGPQWPMHRIVVAALLLMASGNTASASAESFEGLMVVRFVAGIGEGLALACAAATVAHFSNPDRLFAWIMVGMSAYGMAGLIVMPYIIDAVGIAGVFVGMAALPIVTLPLFRSLPDHSQDTRSSTELPITPPILLVLASLMIVYVAMNGVWAYYERIGVSISISSTDIGIALSAGLFASMVGALIAAAIADRFSRLLLLSTGVCLTGLSIVILYVAGDFGLYVASVTLLFGASGFTVPYFLGQLADFDHTGRLPVAGYLTIFLGNFIGPALAAGLVTNGSYTPLMAFSFALFALAVALVIVSLRPTKRDA